MQAAILCPEIELDYTVENASSAPTAEDGGLRDEDVQEARERQQRMEETEKQIVSTENKRNEIEQHIYHLRDKADEKSMAEHFGANEKQALVLYKSSQCSSSKQSYD